MDLFVVLISKVKAMFKQHYLEGAFNANRNNIKVSIYPN